jgi:hypothetical protein
MTACLILLATALMMPVGEHPNASEKRTAPSQYAVEPISPIEPTRGLDLAKVRLGERLFSDVRVSRGGESRASRATSWTMAERIITISARRLKLAGCSIATHRQYSMPY